MTYLWPIFKYLIQTCVLETLSINYYPLYDDNQGQKLNVYSSTLIATMNRRSSQRLCRWKFLFILLFFTLNCDPARGSVRLWGGGATFPTEMYEAWIPAFDSVRRQFTTLSMEYASAGSGIGKDYIVRGKSELTVDYVGSDAVLTQNEYNVNPDLQMFPVVGG